MAAGDREGRVRLAETTRSSTDQPPASLILAHAWSWARSDQETLALESLRRAQRRYPDNFAITQSLVLGRLVEGYPTELELAEGVRFATAAVALNPRAGMTRAILGRGLASQGRFDAAEFEFREAIRLQPDYPNIYTHYGVMLCQASRGDESVAEFRQAIRLKPDWIRARFELAKNLLDLGRVDEAISEYREMIRRDPDNASLHYYLGNFLRDEGRLDEAVASIARRSASIPGRATSAPPRAIRGHPEETRPRRRGALRIPRGDPSRSR